MASIVPEHLRKPELVYDVYSRGEAPGGDMRTLWIQFRQILGVPQVWDQLLNMKEELESCKERNEELRGEISSWSNLPTGLS